jgi:hypothetical protein
MEPKHHKVALVVLAFFAILYTAYIFNKRANEVPAAAAPVEVIEPVPAAAPVAPAK